MLCSARDCIPQEPLDNLHSKFDLHPSALQGIAPDPRRACYFCHAVSIPMLGGESGEELGFPCVLQFLFSFLSRWQPGQALPSQPSQKFGQVKQGRGAFPF